ncbi:WXG100 family type VII secretion target [Streptomyces olivaceoviridis]
MTSRTWPYPTQKKLGEGVDWATDKVGEGLDEIGAHKWADAVEDWGDGISSDLGATPGEQQLGQSEEANELVHGSPEKIRGSAKHLRDFHGAFDKVGQGLKKVDSSGWQGEGGDAFREKFAVHPAKWTQAAEACGTAATALESYADTVKWAQGQAKEAVELYKKGVKASKDAVEAYNKNSATPPPWRPRARSKPPWPTPPPNPAPEPPQGRLHRPSTLHRHRTDPIHRRRGQRHRRPGQLRARQEERWSHGRSTVRRSVHATS